MTNPWPLERDCVAFYGNPVGKNGNASVLWKLRNLTTIKPPFAMHMGNVPITRITVHRKCAAAFSAWLQKVWDNAGHSQAKIHEWGMDVFSGSFNPRPKRDSSSISMHYFACAMDMDAPRNGFHSQTGHFKEFYQQVVVPFLDLGGEWGGNWVHSTDPMHFQFALTSSYKAAPLAPRPALVPISTKPGTAAPVLAKPFVALPSALPAPNRLIGETPMAATPSTQTVNIGSILLGGAGLGVIATLVTKLPAEYTAYGIAGCGAAAVGLVLQAFIAPADAKAVLSGVSSLIPAFETFFPQFKAELEQMRGGLNDVAAQVAVATTTAQAADTKATTAVVTANAAAEAKKA